jgi:hypothetical protein
VSAELQFCVQPIFFLPNYTLAFFLSLLLFKIELILYQNLCLIFFLAYLFIFNYAGFELELWNYTLCPRIYSISTRLAGLLQFHLNVHILFNFSFLNKGNDAININIPWNINWIQCIFFLIEFIVIFKKLKFYFTLIEFSLLFFYTISINNVIPLYKTSSLSHILYGYYFSLLFQFPKKFFDLQRKWLDQTSWTN